ncbi:MAG: universal stress protein [Bacteroidota bacterium]
MPTIQNILVPFVLSPSAQGALKTAISISKINNAKLHVAHIVNEKSTPEILDTIKTICTQENAPFVYVERKGNIHKEIIKLESELNADLIVMGAYGSTGFQQFWVGSNAFKVVSTSHCPVITLQNESDTFAGFHKIMMPLDDSEETRQKANWVAKIAKGFDAEVLIFCVSKSKTEESRIKLAKYASQVDNFLKQEGVRTSFDESYGNNIAEDCIKFAGIHHCDMISIMTEMETTNSFFMGSYAQQLVSTSPIPVLSIHSRSTHLSAHVS